MALAFLIDVKKCELYYRNGDFCNEGKVPMVSGIMLCACALVAFLVNTVKLLYRLKAVTEYLETNFA